MGLGLGLNLKRRESSVVGGRTPRFGTTSSDSRPLPQALMAALKVILSWETVLEVSFLIRLASGVVACALNRCYNPFHEVRSPEHQPQLSFSNVGRTEGLGAPLFEP